MQYRQFSVYLLPRVVVGARKEVHDATSKKARTRSASRFSPKNPTVVNISKFADLCTYVLKTPCSIQTTIDTMQCNTNKLTFVASPKGKVKVMMIKE